MNQIKYYKSASSELRNERAQVGMELYERAQKGEIKEQNLNLIIENLSFIFNKSTSQNKEQEKLQFEILGKYLLLFSKSSDPSELATNIITNLNTIFRKKLFGTKSSSSSSQGVEDNSEKEDKGES